MSHTSCSRPFLESRPFAPFLPLFIYFLSSEFVHRTFIPFIHASVLKNAYMRTNSRNSRNCMKCIIIKYSKFRTQSVRSVRSTANNKATDIIPFTQLSRLISSLFISFVFISQRGVICFIPLFGYPLKQASRQVIDAKRRTIGSHSHRPLHLKSEFEIENSTSIRSLVLLTLLTFRCL